MSEHTDAERRGALMRLITFGQYVASHLGEIDPALSQRLSALEDRDAYDLTDDLMDRYDRETLDRVLFPDVLRMALEGGSSVPDAATDR